MIFREDARAKRTKQRRKKDKDAVVSDRDCTDFRTQDEAQRFFEQQGGPGKDPHGLDNEHDGIACETLP